jgi:hypothetical protein
LERLKPSRFRRVHDRDFGECLAHFLFGVREALGLPLGLLTALVGRVREADPRSSWVRRCGLAPVEPLVLGVAVTPASLGAKPSDWFPTYVLELLL